MPNTHVPPADTGLPQIIQPTSRRALLRSIAAAPLAVAGATVGAHIASAAAHPDAELLEAFADWQAAADAYDQACDAEDEAQYRLVWPMPPEELFLHPGDDLLLTMCAPVHSRTGRRWYGPQEMIKGLREELDPSWTNPNAFTESDLARRREILAAADKWEAEKQAALQRAGIIEAENRYRDTVKAREAHRARVLPFRAMTLEGARAKAAIVAWEFGGLETIEAELDGADEGLDIPDTEMCLSILRDLLRMGGEA